MRIYRAFLDPNMTGQMQTTVSLKKVSVDTELTVVQEGIPSAIPAEACYLGWQESQRCRQLRRPPLKSAQLTSKTDRCEPEANRRDGDVG